MGGRKADNGQFKNGAWAKVEAIMQQKLPDCDKRAKHHIESRLNLLRRHYDAIAEMSSPSSSGFGWNGERKFVTCPQAVWDDWVKVTIEPSFSTLHIKSLICFELTRNYDSLTLCDKIWLIQYSEFMFLYVCSYFWVY